VTPAIVGELPVDASFEYSMEERALAIALAMAGASEQQTKIERLIDLRADLIHRRQAYSTKAAINLRAPSREELDTNAKGLYMGQGSSEDVLRVHAQSYFTSVLVSKRRNLALLPADIAQSAREMHAHEEAFARAWIGAVGDPIFVDEMRAYVDVDA
jgi:hypothetical protein